MEKLQVSEINKLQQTIEQELSSLEFNIEPRNLYDPIKYVFSNGGKRVRSILLLLSFRLFSDEIEKALPAALAIEIFHNFTLVHDDIMDKAPLRRNKETIHVKYGNNSAILSGDVMLVKAYQMLATYKEGILSKILNDFNEIAIKVCEGQQFDVEFESIDNVSIDDYLMMIELKTACLLAGSSKIGAVIGGANEGDSDHLYEFGKNIGIAFQIQDDLLDLYGEQGKFGKKVGGDIISNKKTFLYLSFMELANPEMKKQMKNIYSSDNIDDQNKIIKVKDLYSTLNVKSKVMDRIKFYHNKAMKNLEKVCVPIERKTSIIQIANDLLIRKL